MEIINNILSIFEQLPRYYLESGGQPFQDTL